MRYDLKLPWTQTIRNGDIEIVNRDGNTVATFVTSWEAEYAMDCIESDTSIYTRFEKE